MTDREFMNRAIGLSVDNVANGGGPFGAVIVRNGEIIAEGVNRVTANNDPTAHAEVQAIRMAARKLQTYDLSYCELYTSCEPCPMCMGAVYWARLRRMYFAADKNDAADAGFDDAFIYKEIALPYSHRLLPTEQFMQEEANVAFAAWKNKTDKIEY